ncbi:MAG: glycoside hydrolase family 38 C-terminal domain-containing protein, partial [Eubacteriales bacterium]
KIGYFPDAFGNAGQMPQLLSQGGMDAVVFGRGVRPIGADNDVPDIGMGEYESLYSEMLWQSPDGTDLLGILFANWYSNGNEIPSDEDAAREWWASRLAGVRRFASTGQYLLMNGCDHQPAQTDIARALNVARKLYPDIEFKHSDFVSYVNALRDGLAQKQTDGLSTVTGELTSQQTDVKPSVLSTVVGELTSQQTDVKPSVLSTVVGELTSQQTDGWYTLVNTCSARVYLKQLNRANELLLANTAEPLTVAAAHEGAELPSDFLDYAWKTLMQNHPHDSICGCSCDEVNREMHTRFEKSMQVGSQIVSDSAKTVAECADTSMFSGGELPFILYNTSGWDFSGELSCTVDLVRDYRLTGGWQAAYDALAAIPTDDVCVKSADGCLHKTAIRDLGVVFDYDLPDDKFRQPCLCRRVELSFTADAIPSLGYAVFAVTHGKTNGAPSLVCGENMMENDTTSVKINADGTFDMTDKQSGHVYRSLGAYEDTGDIGNEYIYSQARGCAPITSYEHPAKVSLLRDDGIAAVYEIKITLDLPESADEKLEDEIKRLVEFRSRTAGRSAKLIPTEITTTVTLERGCPMVKLTSSFDNRCRDHRLRMLFPADLVCDTHKADSMFEIVRRANHTDAAWQNPSNCQHQQYFASLSDGENGIMAANIGLNEYEILPRDDGTNVIAVTLIRSVGEIGDWGVFPTPEAQCIGKTSLELAVMPFAGDVADSGAFRFAHLFQNKPVCAQTAVHGGKAPRQQLTWSGKSIGMTAFKAGYRAPDVSFARFVNYSDKPCALDISVPEGEIYRSDVTERIGDMLGERRVSLTLRPFEIFTAAIK